MSKKIIPRGSKILIKKELKLLFKSKRTIFFLIVVPMFILSIGILGGFANRNAKLDSVVPVQISILDEDPSNNTTLLKSYWSSINNTEIIEITGDYSTIVGERNFQVFVYIPSNFTNIIESGNVSSILIVYNSNSTNYQAVAFQVLELTLIFEDQLIRSNNPDVIFDLIDPRIEISEGDRDNVSDEELLGELVVLPVYILFLVVLTPVSLTLISVTTEREQKTLEMLFLQPIKRSHIVLGKVYYGLALVIITLLLDVVAVILSIFMYTLIGSTNISEVFEPTDNNTQAVDILAVGGFLLGLMIIVVNIIAFAVLLSLLAKDEREASMISGLLPLLLFSLIIFTSIIPLEDLSIVSQAILSSLPVIGLIIAIYLSGIAGEIFWISYFSFVMQILWAYFTILLITRISEVEGIMEISYGKLFKKLKHFILRK